MRRMCGKKGPKPFTESNKKICLRGEKNEARTLLRSSTVLVNKAYLGK